MRKIALLFSCVFLSVFMISQRYELPNDTVDMIKMSKYSFKYSEKHEVPKWVAYSLDSTMFSDTLKRLKRFTENGWVITGTANDADYYKSGYDRGHMAPAADMAYNYHILYQSFMYSNVCPQHPSLNRGAWRTLEKVIREWAQEDKLYICVGPILFGQNKSIGANRVTVPEYFFKVVRKKGAAIGFIMPNRKCYSDITMYVVSVDFVEALTGIDMFYRVNNEEIESKVDWDLW